MVFIESQNYIFSIERQKLIYTRKLHRSYTVKFTFR